VPARAHTIWVEAHAKDFIVSRAFSVRAVALETVPPFILSKFAFIRESRPFGAFHLQSGTFCIASTLPLVEIDSMAISAIVPVLEWLLEPS
jgi:hypothetical protein